MQPILTQQSSVADIASFLDKAKNDEELKAYVALMNREGKLTFGPNFNLRVDETSMSQKLRDRVFITRP
jgi:hypothetical protein